MYTKSQIGISTQNGIQTQVPTSLVILCKIYVYISKYKYTIKNVQVMIIILCVILIFIVVNYGKETVVIISTVSLYIIVVLLNAVHLNISAIS